MKLDKIILLLKRLYKNYVRKHLDKIFMSLFFSVLLAGTTSAIAWLLDPAVKKIFIENDKTYSWLIPILIVLAFSTKGISLYFARSITMILGFKVKQEIQNEMARAVLSSDLQTIESKHTGKYLSHFMYDIGLIHTLAGTALLNLMKEV